MTYFITLQDTLIFFLNEQKSGYPTIREIASAIKDSSVEETRQIVVDFLIQNEIVLGCYDEKTGKFQVENKPNKNF